MMDAPSAAKHQRSREFAYWIAKLVGSALPRHVFGENGRLSTSAERIIFWDRYNRSDRENRGCHTAYKQQHLTKKHVFLFLEQLKYKKNITQAAGQTMSRTSENFATAILCVNETKNRCCFSAASIC